MFQHSFNHIIVYAIQYILDWNISTYFDDLCSKLWTFFLRLGHFRVFQIKILYEALF